MVAVAMIPSPFSSQIRRQVRIPASRGLPANALPRQEARIARPTDADRDETEPRMRPMAEPSMLTQSAGRQRGRNKLICKQGAVPFAQLQGAITTASDDSSTVVILSAAGTHPGVGGKAASPLWAGQSPVWRRLMFACYGKARMAGPPLLSSPGGIGGATRVTGSASAQRPNGLKA